MASIRKPSRIAPSGPDIPADGAKSTTTKPNPRKPTKRRLNLNKTKGKKLPPKPVFIEKDPFLFEYEVLTPKGQSGTPEALVPRSDLTKWSMKENQLFEQDLSYISDLAEAFCAAIGYEEDKGQKFWRNLVRRVQEKKAGLAGSQGGSDKTDEEKADEEIEHPLLEFIRKERLRKGNKKELVEALDTALLLKEFAETLSDCE